MYTLLSGCAGYKPIFTSGNISFDIAEHKIEGNEILGKKIYSKLRTLSNSLRDLFLYCLLYLPEKLTR